jgi:hypothetical protein
MHPHSGSDRLRPSVGSGPLAEGSVDRASGTVVARRHKVHVGAEREARITLFELRPRPDRLTRAEEERGAGMTENVHPFLRVSSIPTRAAQSSRPRR